MDSDSSNQMRNPKPLKTLASGVQYPNKNNLLHQFVLDNSDPNHSVSQNYINAVLVAMNGSAVDVNALNNDGYTPLYLAVMNNNFLMVKKLLSCLVNIDVNVLNDVIERCGNYGETDVPIEDTYHNTALYFAVSSGNLDIVKLLVSKGANLDEINEGRGALYCAAQSGNLEVVKYLVSIGADVNAKDYTGSTSLHGAARSGDLATVEFLVSQGANVNAIDRYRETPLHNAARIGNLDIIKFLLGRCVNFNIESEGGLVLCAAQSGDLVTMQFFIDKGADVNAKGKNEYTTPLHYAVKSCNLEAIKLLVDNGADLNSIDEVHQTPLHCAVKCGNLEAIKFLVDNGADLNSKDEYHETPLHYAMDMNIKVIQYLVDKGANVNAIDRKGQTPLHRLLAMLQYTLEPYYNEETDNESYSKPDEINKGLMKIQLLLEANADVNIKDMYGSTPLRYAIDFTNSDIVEFLLEREVDLKVKCVDDDTLLHRACIGNDILDIIEMLLTKGCDVNARNKIGETPLHAAAHNKNSAYTQLLLERGASVHAADVHGWTPLHWAAYNGHVEVIRALLDKGADKKAINTEGKTPFDSAKENNHPLCMDALQ